MKHLSGRVMTMFCSIVLTCAAQVNGSGNVGTIPLWTGSSSPTSTLGDSTIFETQGMVGVGTTNPTATLHVVGPNGIIQASPNAPTALRIVGGTGANGTFPSTPTGLGGGITLSSGRGGNFCCGNNNSRSTGGFGALIQITGGLAFKGASVQINGGLGGTSQVEASVQSGGAGGSINVTGGSGSGGSVQINGGNGGTDKFLLGSSIGLGGGSITLQPGLGGFGTKSSGSPGNLILAPNGGKIGIGETAPANTLEVKVGGTTLADAWTVRSSQRFKTNIQPLLGALEKVEQLRGVSYDRKDDGRHEIGVIAEETAMVMPEVVSRDPQTNEVQGVDYARLSALLIEAVKTQQAEIKQLQDRLDELTSKTRQ